ncbi:unnamed protein product [Prunus brigantina]
MSCFYFWMCILQVLRLQKVHADVNTIHELSVVMSIDFSKAVNEVHLSLSDHSSAYSKNSQVLHLTYHLALILTFYDGIFKSHHVCFSFNDWICCDGCCLRKSLGLVLRAEGTCV